MLIEGRHIRTVDDWAALAAMRDVAILDARELTLLPGLIDAHTHVVHSGEPDENWRTNAISELPALTALKAARHALLHLGMGVTTIRDLGSRDWVDIALRDAIEAGWQPGPRMLVAGHGITATGGHMDPRRGLRPGIAVEQLGGIGVVADSPDEARRAAWEQLLRGADVLKLNATLSEYVRAAGGQCSPELSFEAMRAICEVAHGAGRKVAAHCHGGPGVTAALDAGVDTFEHGRFLDDRQLERMAAQGAFLVPTLSPEARGVQHNVVPSAAGDRRWIAMATEHMYATVERAYRHGVPIVAGSDAAMPYVRHGEIAYEIAQLAAAGLPNMVALEAATSVAARALGLDDCAGRLRAGFEADLLLVDGDPLADLTILQSKAAIKIVIRQGRIVVDRRADGAERSNAPAGHAALWQRDEIERSELS